MSIIATFSDDYYGVNGAWVGNWMMADGYSVAVGTMEQKTGPGGTPPVPRNGRAFLQVGGGAPSKAWQTPGDQATLVVGRGFMFSSADVLWRIMQFRENDGVDITEHLALFRTTNNGLQVRRGTTTETGGGTVLATSAAGAIIPGNTNWNFIEWKSTIDDTNGATVVRVNGTEVINETGLDTQNGANSVVNEVSWDEDGDVWVDGGYILDTTGTRLNDFPGGELIFYTLRANAVGDQDDFTPTGAATNHECVDDDAVTTGAGAVTVENGNADYVESSGVGDKDLLNAADLPADIKTVHWIEAVVYARRTGGGTTKVKVKVKEDGTEAESAAVAVPVTFEFARYPSELTPDSQGWTPGKVNNTQLGYEADNSGLRVSSCFMIVACEGSSGFSRLIGTADDLTITTYAPVAQVNLQKNPPVAVGGGLVITTHVPDFDGPPGPYGTADLVITSYIPMLGTNVGAGATTTLTITTYIPDASSCVVWHREAPIEASWAEV